MANDKRICKTCGAEYRYCPTCAKYVNMPSWMWKCDTEECNELFDAISAYKMGIKDKNNIKNVLDKYGVKDYSKYTSSIQEVLNNLFPKKKTKVKDIEKMDIDLNLELETLPVEESTEPKFNGISELE